MRLLRCNILKTMKIRAQVVDCEQCQSSNNNELNANRQRAMSIIINDRQRIEKCRSKLTVTIYLSTSKCLFGRLPIFVYFILESSKYFKDNSVKSGSCGGLENLVFAVTSFCVYFSYSISFFLFYYCNHKFRKISNSYFLKILRNLHLIGCNYNCTNN